MKEMLALEIKDLIFVGEKLVEAAFPLIAEFFENELRLQTLFHKKHNMRVFQGIRVKYADNLACRFF